MSVRPGTDGAIADLLVRSGRFFTRSDVLGQPADRQHERVAGSPGCSTGIAGATTRSSGPRMG